MCGVEWLAGTERCSECSFAPVGDGRDKLPKRATRKRVFETQGSFEQSCRLGLAILVSGYCAVERPWQGSFYEVKELFTHTGPHTIRGDWDIVKSVRLRPGEKAVLSEAKVVRGRLSFSQGRARLVFEGKRPIIATASYVEFGDVVRLSGVHAEKGAALPSSMNMAMAYYQRDYCIAKVNNAEAVYLRRRVENPTVASLATVQPIR